MRKTAVFFIAVLLAVSMIVGFSFTGCKKEAGEETTVAETTVAETTAAETTAAEIETKKPIKFKVMCYDNMIANYKAYDGVTDSKFMKENNVEIEYVPVTAASEDLLARYGSIVSSKDQSVGVIVLFLPYIVPFADAGLLLPLDGKIPKEYTDDLIQWDSYSYKGQHWAVNWVNDVAMIYYRKDLFKEAGLDPEKPPTTLEELSDYAKKLTKKDADGNTTVAGFGFWGHTQQAYCHPIFQFGGDAISRPDGKAIFNSPEGVKAFEWFKDLWDAGVFLSDTPVTDVHGAFLDGKLAMFEQYAYFTSWANAKWGSGNIGIAAYPGDKKLTFAGHAYAVNAFTSPEIQEIAIKWIQFFNGPEAQLFFDSGVQPIGPPFLSILSDPKQWAIHPDWKIMYDTEKNRQCDPLAPEPYVKAWRDAFTEIVTDMKSVQAALDDAAASLEPDSEYMKLDAWNQPILIK